MMEIHGGNDLQMLDLPWPKSRSAVRDLSFLPLVCQVSHPRGTAPVVISALRRAKRIFWTYQKIWIKKKKHGDNVGKSSINAG